MEWMVFTYPFKVFGGQWSSAPLPIVIKGDTIVGNDVWIGHGATLMPGVNIGDGAIIGTNSLVTKDVEPYTIVGGNPAKAIRKRFDDETIQLLLAIKWWDWDMQKISNRLKALTSAKIDELKQIDKDSK